MPMNFTYHPKYLFFVLPSNILGIYIYQINWKNSRSSRLLRFVWRFVVSILTGNGQSGSRDRKNLIGCYWKYYENRSFYQISWITIIVIFLRRTCCFHTQCTIVFGWTFIMRMCWFLHHFCRFCILGYGVGNGK